MDLRLKETATGAGFGFALPLTLLAGILSALAGWRGWINPFVDSSREMNVPARLAEGERLYRDVAYHYGPAGPWINALSIGVFGHRFAALELSGLLAGALLLVCLYRLTVRAGSKLSAGMATIWASALCVGAPNGGAFLFPYSFGALFGIAGGLLCLDRALEAPTLLSVGLGAMGLAFALAAKVEIGVAAATVLLVALARSRNLRREAKRTLPILAGGFALATGVYAVAFAGLRWSDVSPEGPMALFHTPRQWRAVYAAVSGMASPTASARWVATALFLDLILLAPLAFLARKVPTRAAGIIWSMLVLGGTLFFSLRPGGSIEDRLPPLLSPMPAACTLAALVLLCRPIDQTGRARLLLFGFAAATASRVFLGVAYGAVTNPYTILAFSGLAASAAVLTVDAPPVSLSGCREWRTGVAVLFLSLAVVALVRWRRLEPSEIWVPIATPAGTLRLPRDRAIPIAQTLAYLRQKARPGDGLTGFSEGGFFNFVTGLRNPLREEQVLPGHLDAEEERRVAARIDQNGPRFILLANQPAPAFGQKAFGQDYDLIVWREVERHYRLVASFGAPPQAPLGRPPFFLRVYERVAR